MTELIYGLGLGLTAVLVACLSMGIFVTVLDVIFFGEGGAESRIKREADRLFTWNVIGLGIITLSASYLIGISASWTFSGLFPTTKVFRPDLLESSKAVLSTVLTLTIFALVVRVGGLIISRERASTPVEVWVDAIELQKIVIFADWKREHGRVQSEWTSADERLERKTMKSLQTFELAIPQAGRKSWSHLAFWQRVRFLFNPCLVPASSGKTWSVIRWAHGLRPIALLTYPVDVAAVTLLGAALIHAPSLAVDPDRSFWGKVGAILLLLTIPLILLATHFVYGLLRVSYLQLAFGTQRGQLNEAHKIMHRERANRSFWKRVTKRTREFIVSPRIG